MRNPLTLLAKAWRLLAQEGPAAVLRRVRSLAWRRWEYVVFRKVLGEEVAGALQVDVEFRVAGPEDIPWISRQIDHLTDAQAERLLKEQFQGRDITVVGVSAGAEPGLMFSAWLSHDGLDLRALGDRVGPDDVSIRRVEVPERCRRRGLATRGMRFAEQAAWKAGRRRIWSLVLTDNVASLGLHQKLGYEDRGRVRLVRWFGKCYVRTRLAGDLRWSKVRVANDVSKL
ncbi:MAG: GNAT family N-acetyltransferase [Phycisphaerae bacterium]